MMRNFNENEYMKLFRKMVYWEWYTDVNTTKLFLHCLLMAHWKPGRWRGIPYERGQFFTSLSSLAKETGLSTREVRTALEHLEATNEVTIKTTSKYSVITVVSFDKYQGERQSDDTQDDTQDDKPPTSHRHAKRQQNKNIKNNKNNKNIEEDIYTASPDEDEDDYPYGDDEDDEEGFVIPQQDENGNWIDPPEWDYSGLND